MAASKQKGTTLEQELPAMLWLPWEKGESHEETGRAKQKGEQNAGIVTVRAETRQSSGSVIKTA